MCDCNEPNLLLAVEAKAEDEIKIFASVCQNIGRLLGQEVEDRIHMHMVQCYMMGYLSAVKDIVGKHRVDCIKEATLN